MTTTESYINERLDYLGIVGAWLDTQDPGNRKPGECGNIDGCDNFQERF